MQFVQHSSRLPIDNLDFFEDEPPQKKHGSLFSNSVRLIMAGPSGCGKSNALLALLFSPNGIKFENVYIYSKTLFQNKYRLLAEVLSHIPEIGYFPYQDTASIIHPAEAKQNSICIFDDIISDKQDKVKAYYAMCRHKSVDVAFLCQTYVKIDKHLIRDNANLIVVFKQDDINLKHIFYEHVSPDMTFEKFRDLCSSCWNHDNYGFLVIAKDFGLNDGRYRRNFDSYIKIEN